MSFKKFKTALYDSFEKQVNCDVTFSCSDPTSSNGTSIIKAHKYTLSLASDVFHTMFYGEAAKQENVKDKDEPINIEDIKMPTFRLFLSFIYNKLVDFETFAKAAEFYYAAHKYNATDALGFIKAYMLKEVKPENAIFFYDIACIYENQELKDACVKIFSENTMAILNSPAFLNADPKTIEVIYKLDALNINSEMELIKALERYIEHNKADNSDITEEVRPALNQIRFLTLAAPVIAQTTLLNSEESLAVIGYLCSNGTISKMPTFLSSNNQKRAHTISAMEMMRNLNPVFTDKFCVFCIKNEKKSCNHAYWNCTTLTHSDHHRKIRSIYEKYNHVWLLDYDSDDLKYVYEVYQQRNYINWN